MHKLKLIKFKIPVLGMSKNFKFNSFITNINNRILNNEELIKKRYEISYKKVNGLQVPIISTKNKVLFEIIEEEYNKIKG